jgi:maltooligosyltrehalose trehalohydrolase
MPKVGAYYAKGFGCEFSVWAPLSKEIQVELNGEEKNRIPLVKDEFGYWSVYVPDVMPNTRYKYVIDTEQLWPDPASFFQPNGVHAASQVIDHSQFPWTDRSWKNHGLADYIIYELHIGTFTPEGTFAAACEKLDHVCELGVSAVEIMPVAQFPGARNWGYDGAYPYAVQDSYGGPDGLKAFVDCAHTKGLAVILDVVYNHLGPEGNYLWAYAPYFTDKYKTPWGNAVNFDDAYSYGVREYFIGNALYWLEHFHIDALRLDAIHGIYDMGAKHFLTELHERVKDFNQAQKTNRFLIAESDLNDIRVIASPDDGGYGMDAQWSDDFHHSLHVLFTGEKNGYYEDFTQAEDVLRAITHGFVYDWKYSRHRKRFHGSSALDMPAGKCIVAIQNHDQIGNRMLGERLSALVSFDSLKCAAALMLLMPYVPLLFMGEEVALDSPFLYFVSHSDKDLISAVRAGRKAEFRAFGWDQEPPDPQDERTFLRSKFTWQTLVGKRQRCMFDFYKKLIQIRKKYPLLRDGDKKTLHAFYDETNNTFAITRSNKTGLFHIFLNPNTAFQSIGLSAPVSKYQCILNTADQKWCCEPKAMPEECKAENAIGLSPLSLILLYKEL